MTTDLPERRSSRAAVKPAKPAPTTITSTRAGRGRLDAAALLAGMAAIAAAVAPKANVSRREMFPAVGFFVLGIKPP